MSKQILKVLIDLLGQDSDEVSDIWWCLCRYFCTLFALMLHLVLCVLSDWETEWLKL